MTTEIKVVLPEGNFDSPEDAARTAKMYRKVCADLFPGVEPDIEVIENQTGGGKTIVLVDGDEDEKAADYINAMAERA